jgi:FtsH-binding integral membrane protein
MSSVEELHEQHPEQIVALDHDRARAVFGQTMGLVALTCAVAALGAYLGRDISHGWSIVAWIGAFACIIGLGRAVERSEQLAIGLLFGLGACIGLALAPALAYYTSVEPQAVWQAAGTTALFIAGFGAYGYATRRDLAPLARIAFFALLGLIVFGIVLFFVSIPAGNVIYAVLGLVIFAGLTMFDFQRLRRTKDIRSAPVLAASIFLDIVNVFMLLLSLFGGGGRR